MKHKKNKMVIGVDCDKNGKVTIYKPSGDAAGALSDDYNVFQNAEGKPEIYVRWHQKLPRPVIFEFSSNEPITSMGFAGCACDGEIEQYTRKGPCGGNFFLRTDLSRGGMKKVEVENWGHNRGHGYVLKFGVGNTTFDPQIYNEGELPPPHEEPKLGGCLSVLGLLFTGWLR